MTRTATAAVLREYGAPLRLETVTVPELRDDEVLVQIHGVGICHTDLTAAAGGVPVPTPVVLGHEGAGVVTEVGSAVTALAVGDRVVLGFDSCRTCRNCARGRHAYCTRFAPLNYSGVRTDGSAVLRDADGAPVHGNWFGQSSFSSLVVATERNAVRLPADVPVALAGPLGCGLATGAGTVLEVLRPEQGSTIVVFGLGAVGTAAVMAARIAGCESIIGVDPNPRRHGVARSLGATEVLSPDDHDDLGRHLRRLTGGGADYAVEAVGTESVIRQALSSLTSPGVCATLGLRAGRNPVSIDQTHLLSGRTLTGVIEGDVDPHRFLPELAALWRDGRFPVDELVQTFDFTKLDDALAAVTSGEVVKAVLTFDIQGNT
ncbi:NAD(P)-dependent alcohol dehydrogenase [Rhodococcus rhodochrous]|uniref:NAD(P)-dependent alcohol dehydrogenase n=1 Tax=Rhodococcus rhodochrous TaxID=1829 RepID=A0AAW4XLW3_RHORH|nr:MULTISPECIES: NAD(P)-dependent alcohol dehydrogenase [Rhodococcus]MCD2114006.1 NAD(P)-dependent alcohol dehydrogenase [Rhodococcus rhodochrous]WAL46910.1 NAD(P)-dependent alcohol dehydrogenase [Rhodococcus pyridinivorans]